MLVCDDFFHVVVIFMSYKSKDNCNDYTSDSRAYPQVFIGLRGECAQPETLTELACRDGDG